LGRIVVIGGANIDIKAKTLEPQRLGTSNPGFVSLTPGGVARNIAHNLARLGAEVSLVAALGEDGYGDEVLRKTAAAGVDVSQALHAAQATGTYVALLGHDGELVTAVSDMRAVEAITPDIIATKAALIASAQFVVADCNLSIPTLIALAQLCRDKLVIEPVSVPKSAKLMSVLAQGPLFLASPNFDQMDALSGNRDIHDAFAFLHAKGLRNAVIHAGEDGAFVSDGRDIELVEPHPPEKIVDVTGAGDAAVAGLVYGLSLGESLIEAAARGQACAGRVIGTSASTL
jgi:pseudouridine kinase